MNFKNCIINYTIIDRHLQKLKTMSKERAEYLTVLTIFRPVSINNILFSICTDTAFLNLLDQKYDDENDVKFLPCTIGTTTLEINRN